MDEKQFELLMKKIDALTKLLAFDIIKGKSVNEQVDALTKVGIKASVIAELLGKTENQIYVTQTQLRKAKKKESSSSIQQSTQTETTNNV